MAVNWLIKPLTMTALAWMFIRGVFAAWIPEAMGQEYVAGMILLGVAPCTAMVFVWSRLSDRDPSYTLGAGGRERPDHGVRLCSDRSTVAGGE